MSYADNKRIAKNTIYLYIRTFVSMIVALYTSRKILEALGVDDFGIFNVVGGIISLMSFINGSMSVATQRYLTYELGRGTEGQFNKVFNMAVYIHAIIAVIVLIAAETMGVWFVNTQLNIPEVRMEAANWVFQATILTTILGILQTPYNAAIISHEHMHIYAYVGLGETLAKLFIVWGLFYYPYDRLSIWGFAIFLLQFLIAMIYRMYCSRQFPECRLHLRWNKAIFNSMVQFTGWNMFGTIAWLLKDQGINILMNLFGGPVANAARGVSCQVSGAIQNLTGGFQSAVNPQLTKRYATHESEETCDLMCKSSKISYFLLFTIALPVMMETDFILDLWLVEVPPMTASFTRIIIIEALLNAFGGPMITSLMATGNIKWYQIVVSSSLLFIIPVAYLLLKSGYSIETPLIVSVIFIMIGNIVRLMFCKKQLGLAFRQYTWNVVFPIAGVSALAIIFPLGIHVYMTEGWSRLLITTFVSCTAMGILTYTIGLTASERTFIISYVTPKAKKFFHID